MDKSEGLSEIGEIDIAIVGMACRFPGADDIDSFWCNLREGVESISFFSDYELIERGVPAELLNDPHYIRAGAHVNDADCFDASFFGYTPREAAETDPQHRLFLEVAWQALENAGYDASRYADLIGVYAGCGMNTYLMLNLLASERMDRQDISALQGLMSGNNNDSITTTVAYKLNLRGPAITVQTACSTSLAAVHVACRGLLNHEADMAIAGGAWINLLHENGYYYQPGAILSPDGHCRAFDAKAEGTVVGSGVGVIVLKRLTDALTDGDTIHAVIKGSAINNDGSSKIGYTAPSIEGQAEVIMAAHAIAGVSADTISYIETHGTGTIIGDPIEVAALTQAFRESTSRQRFCGIGSVKTNVGHLDAAAGVAGLIKTVLSLEHRILPPSLNFKQPNPQINFSSSPFYVNTTSKAWPSSSTPRRAGVSSFGIGGTNVHMIVEEAPSASPSGLSRNWQILMISARSQEALEKAVIRLQGHMTTHSQQPLADTSYTLQIGRKHFSYRAIALCHDHADAVAVLKNRDSDRFMMQKVALGSRPVTFMFPGQGAQYVDMALDLYQHEPIFREQFDRCLLLLKPHIDFDLLKLLYPETDKEHISASMQLAQTKVAQPVLFVIEYTLAKLWMSWGIEPASLIGHSIGEYVAACLAGVLSLQDALQIVAMRGRLLQKMEPGAMMTVMLPESELAPYLVEGCDLAAVNGPALCVLSGPIGVIQTVEEKLVKNGIVTRRLHVSHAFHSEMVNSILQSFVATVAKVKLHKPKIPFFSNVSGDWINPQQAMDAAYWGQHLRGTVKFNDGLQELLSNPAQVLLEVGPGETLTTLAQRHPLVKSEQLILSSLPHPNKGNLTQKHFYLSLGKLWLSGLRINWESFYTYECRRRIPLPTYPFERQSYWVKPANSPVQSPPRINSYSAMGSRDLKRKTKHTIDDWLYTSSWQRDNAIELNRVIAEGGASYLILADENIVSVTLTEQLSLLDIDIIVVSSGATFQRRNKQSYSVRPNEINDFKLLFQHILDSGKTVSHIFHLWSLTQTDKIKSQEESLTRNFYSLCYLAKSLENFSKLIPLDKRLDITVVTNQLADVTGVEILNPEKALLQGPCKVIPQEYPNLNCRIIDIESQTFDTGAGNRLVKQILCESQADSNTSTVAYRGPYRWTQQFKPIQYSTAIRNRFKHEGVYLITGGLGGIGLTLAGYLARTQQAKLVLLGRSAIPAREHWQQILCAVKKENDNQEGPLRHKIETILQLEALGAKVLLVSANVADLSELEAAVAQSRYHFGNINGIIHAAGEVSSGLLSAKTEDVIRQVFAPKVQGMQALKTVFKDHPLDFMLLCSSLATIAGGLNKIDYCAANAYLDAAAYAAYRESTFPVFSVNWDSWREVGMGANMDISDGVGITPRQGTEVFERIVNGPHIPQVIVSTFDLNTRLNKTQIDLIAQPFAFATATKTKAFPRPALQTAFKLPESELEICIAEIWQSLLGMETIGVDDNLFELGGDSLLGIQLLSRLRANFSVDVHPSDFFRSPTIAALAELVETKLLDEIEYS